MSPSEIDEHDAALRRQTAAAFGFPSWEAFRSWRRDNPSEYRQRARALIELAREPLTSDEDELLSDLNGRLNPGESLKQNR